MFKTQLEIWTYLVNGGTIYQKGAKIRFKDGAVKANIGDGWHFCPISFENPKLFWCEDD